MSIVERRQISTKSIYEYLHTLGQLLQKLPIPPMLNSFHHTVCHQTLNTTRSRRLRTAEAIHELLRLELIGQLPEALIIAGGAATLHELLVLVGEIVESHFAKEELLALVLNLHCQSAQTLISVVHRQAARLLPLIPMTHQNEGQ